MKKHLELKIHGQVQGVNFRSSIKAVTQGLGLSGLVENLPEGTVVVEAEGEEENLKELLDWCRVGPPAAKVFMVEFEFSDSLKNFQSFEIRNKLSRKGGD